MLHTYLWLIINQGHHRLPTTAVNNFDKVPRWAPHIVEVQNKLNYSYKLINCYIVTKHYSKTKTQCQTTDN